MDALIYTINAAGVTLAAFLQAYMKAAPYELLECIGPLAVLLTGLGMFRWSSPKEKWDTWNDLTFPGVVFVVSVMMILISSIIFFYDLADGLKALLAPEAYALNQLSHFFGR